MSKKVIVFGNSESSGLAGRLCKDLAADGFGRKTHDMDLMKRQDRTRFIEKSLKYDTAILCAYAPEFSQVLLLQELYCSWIVNNHQGQILAIGGSSERLLANQPVEVKWLSYPVEKAALRDTMRIINANCYKLYPGVWGTYISPHHMNTRDFQHEDALEVSQVSQCVKWVIEQDYHIEEIAVRSFKGKDAK